MCFNGLEPLLLRRGCEVAISTTTGWSIAEEVQLSRNPLQNILIPSAIAPTDMNVRTKAATHSPSLRAAPTKVMRKAPNPMKVSPNSHEPTR